MRRPESSFKTFSSRERSLIRMIRSNFDNYATFRSCGRENFIYCHAFLRSKIKTLRPTLILAEWSNFQTCCIGNSKKAFVYFMVHFSHDNFRVVESVHVTFYDQDLKTRRIFEFHPSRNLL